MHIQKLLSCASAIASYCKGSKELEKAQKRATKIILGLEHLSYRRNVNVFWSFLVLKRGKGKGPDRSLFNYE